MCFVACVENEKDTALVPFCASTRFSWINEMGLWSHAKGATNTQTSPENKAGNWQMMPRICTTIYNANSKLFMLRSILGIEFKFNQEQSAIRAKYVYTYMYITYNGYK